MLSKSVPVDWRQASDYIQANQPLLLLVVGTILLAYVSLKLLLTPTIPSISVPVPAQAQKGWRGTKLDKPLIQTKDPSVIQCYCPATAQLIDTIKAATIDDVDKAIEKAKAAQLKWRSTSFKQRALVMKTFLKFILENQEDIVRVSCRDSGKTMIDASLGEILVTCEKLRWLIADGETVLKPEKRPVSGLLMIHKKAEVRYEPLGVVAALVSWNYPFHNMMGPLIEAIFAGNGIIIKGSEQTAWSAQYNIQVARAALTACGHDADLVQSIMCYPDVAEHLTSHADIKHVLFIGSKMVAHKVAVAAAKSLTKLTLELGGKDAVVVLNDVYNVKELCSILMRGVFQSASQNCIGLERIICLPKHYNTIVNYFATEVPHLQLGSAIDEGEGVDMGAMINGYRFTYLESLIAQAVKQGARLIHGGKRYHHPKYPQGHYFQPTLLVDVTTDMAIANEELFAPVALLMKVGTLDDAIRVANSTIYGLGGAVFGNKQRDVERVINEVETVGMAVNDFATFYVCQLPFGGTKGSGYGRFMGPEGLRALCNQKSICFDKFPSIARTAIPGVVDYPITNAAKSWKFVSGLMNLAYGQNITTSLGGLVAVLSNLRKKAYRK